MWSLDSGSGTISTISNDGRRATSDNEHDRSYSGSMEICIILYGCKGHYGEGVRCNVMGDGVVNGEKVNGFVQS